MGGVTSLFHWARPQACSAWSPSYQTCRIPLFFPKSNNMNNNNTTSLSPSRAGGWPAPSASTSTSTSTTKALPVCLHLEQVADQPPLHPRHELEDKVLRLHREARHCVGMVALHSKNRLWSDAGHNKTELFYPRFADFGFPGRKWITTFTFCEIFLSRFLLSSS